MAEFQLESIYINKEISGGDGELDYVFQFKGDGEMHFLGIDQRDAFSDFGQRNEKSSWEECEKAKVMDGARYEKMVGKWFWEDIDEDGIIEYWEIFCEESVSLTENIFGKSPDWYDTRPDPIYAREYVHLNDFTFTFQEHDGSYDLQGIEETTYQDDVNNLVAILEFFIDQPLVSAWIIGTIAVTLVVVVGFAPW
jgi:hypothetical protein